MYNPENVRKIKICIRAVLISLVIVPSILMVSVFAKSAQLQEQMENLSQKLRETENQLELEQSLAQEDPDFAVTKAQVKNGGPGEPLSDLYPDMIVEWREDPVQVREEPTVYLTFDDGPSALTPELLDLLDEYNVKATFFVVSNNNEKYMDYCKEIVERGHALGMHSYTHDYQKVYASKESFLADFHRQFTQLKELTGETPVLYRFPGGSDNDRLEKSGFSEDIRMEMASRGFIYHDWNVSSEDASYLAKSKDQIVRNVITGVGNKNHAVVLMHNSVNKASTIEALPEIIETLRARGYQFDKLTSEIKPIHFS